MALSPGARLGAYEIIGLLGAGGMGEVYRALDSSLGREVAIKVLPEAVAQHPERLARFEREARLLASLSHPNIAVVHGLERSPDGCYLVMELVKGETLGERSARGAIPIEETLHIFKQIAEGLEAAHGQAIIHRDLKPANIMITPKGTAKILDFGLAKVVSPEDSAFATRSPTLSSSPTLAGVVMGTAAYMSPEQARGDPVDRRTDIWAFGCLLYECVTGQRAFAGRSTVDTIAAVLREDPDWSKAAAVAPLKLQLLIRRCLQKNPHVRLHDIADARIEIDDVSREPLASAVETGPIDGTRRVVATPRAMWALAAAAVVLVALGAVAGVTWWPVRVTAPGSSFARVMITLPAPQALEKGRFPPVALSPDGRLLVYAAATDGGRTRLYLRPLDELSARPIPETDGASTPFFSPDGRWLAFYADGLLKKVSVAGGVPLTICDAPPVWRTIGTIEELLVPFPPGPGLTEDRLCERRGHDARIYSPHRPAHSPRCQNLQPASPRAQQQYKQRVRGRCLVDHCSGLHGWRVPPPDHQTARCVLMRSSLHADQRCLCGVDPKWPVVQLRRSRKRLGAREAGSDRTRPMSRERGSAVDRDAELHGDARLSSSRFGEGRTAS